nr:hypothetical protein Q903MT_gene375 [Picea sitchensis]
MSFHWILVMCSHDTETGLHSKAYRYMHGSKGLGCFLNQLIMPLGVAEAVEILR